MAALTQTGRRARARSRQSKPTNCAAAAREREAAKKNARARAMMKKTKKKKTKRGCSGGAQQCSRSLRRLVAKGSGEPAPAHALARLAFLQRDRRVRLAAREAKSFAASDCLSFCRFYCRFLCFCSSACVCVSVCGPQQQQRQKRATPVRSLPNARMRPPRRNCLHLLVCRQH